MAQLAAEPVSLELFLDQILRFQGAADISRRQEWLVELEYFASLLSEWVFISVKPEAIGKRHLKTRLVSFI